MAPCGCIKQLSKVVSLRIHSELCISIPRWHSKIGFSLSIPSDSCIYGTWRAHQIHIFVAYPNRFLHIWRLTGTLNVHFRCVSQRILQFWCLAGTYNPHFLCISQVNFAFEAPCWHIKFVFSLGITSDSCILYIKFAFPLFLAERREGSARVPGMRRPHLCAKLVSRTASSFSFR